MKILLLCSAGMSTSLLVHRMKEVAKDRHLNAKIWAKGSDDNQADIEEADVILIGPQMRFILNKIKKIAGNKPVCVIDMMTYGRMDGEHALAIALQALEGE